MPKSMEDLQCRYCKTTDKFQIVDGQGNTITICVNCRDVIHYEDHDFCHECDCWIHFDDTVENPPYSTYFECKFGHALTADNLR